MIREFHFSTKEVGEHLARVIGHQLGLPHGAMIHFKTAFQVTVGRHGPANLLGGDVSRISLVVAESADELEAYRP